jgi:transposase
MITKEALVRKAPESILKPYVRLIGEWYRQYPFLRATQVYERLKSYGFTGSYPTVSIFTQRYRQKRSPGYHELEFLPGEEAQVDWMEWRLASGKAYGFVFILAYSRYLYVRFYPRHSLEFFLEGHIEAYKEIGGVARRNRYDNLKSVVLSRRPELTFNSQFVDFARHYGFSIHACNPGKAHEKGRVERVIRDLKEFLRVTPCAYMRELNAKTTSWRTERNGRVHRVTGRRPIDLLKEEHLKPLAHIHYQPYRAEQASISTTGFISFETNRYSVPIEYADMPCQILAYPERLEVIVRGSKVATHGRIFERNEKREIPSHREKLLHKSPQFKYQRIYELMKNMDRTVESFLDRAEQEGEAPRTVSYELFRLLKHVSKPVLLSAVREASAMGIFKVTHVAGLLRLPEPTADTPVYPKDKTLLEIRYEERNLSDYDTCD